MENSIDFFLKPSLRRVTQNPKDWQHLAWIAHVWPHLAPFCPVCTILPSLVPFGPAWLLWPPLAPFSPIWSCLAPFGLSYPVWCCFALFDPVWPNLSLSKLGVPYLPWSLVWTKIGLDKPYLPTQTVWTFWNQSLLLNSKFWQELNYTLF